MDSILKDCYKMPGVWFRMLFLSFFTGITLATEVPFVLGECSYLDRQAHQDNAYNTTAGFSCCMCPKGTYLKFDCSEGNPTMPHCSPCVYNDESKTYINYEPHVRKTCFRDQPCRHPFIPIGGSRFKKSRCVCPPGSERVNRYHCRKTSTKTQSPPLDIEPKPIPDKPEDEIGVTTTATIDHKGKMEMDPDRGTTGAIDRQGSPTSAPQPASDSSFLLIVGIALVAIVFFAGAGWLVRQKLQKRRRQRTGVPSTVPVNSDQHPSSILVENVKNFTIMVSDALNPNSTSNRNQPASDESSKPLLSHKTIDNQLRNTVPDRRIEHIEMKNMASPFRENEINQRASPPSHIVPPAIPEIDLGQHHQEHGSSSRNGNQQAAPPSGHVPSSNHHQQALASPIGNCGQNAGCPVRGHSQAPENDRTGNRHGMIPQTSHCITPQHKEKRQKVVNSMIDVIVEKDLKMLGNKLLAKNKRDFDDIKRNNSDDTQEMARKTFERALQRNPQLTLQTLLEYVRGLGYLTDIINDELGA